MADQLTNANTIETWKAGDGWWAKIGPADGGLKAGPCDRATGAVIQLALRAGLAGWAFDETWQPPQ